jgi:hypothetical protein
LTLRIEGKTVDRTELSRRQQQLLIRSAELRVALAQQAQVLQAPLALADHVRTGVLWLRDHPQWPIGALILLALKRPRRTLRWAARLGWGWRLYQGVHRWLGRMVAKPQRTQTLS